MKIKNNGGIVQEIEDIKLILKKYYKQEELDKLNTKTRKQEVVEARQIIHTLLRNMSANRYSLKYIGINTGYKDHSTVLHSIKTVEDLCFNKVYKKKFEDIKFQYLEQQYYFEPIVRCPELFSFDEYLK